ncbi:MAG: hypothetical protein GY856_37220 [bacterium]|nr:hypothetical protein [bacterium]
MRECAVLVREDGSGDRRLVAYCTAEGEPAPAELRDFLQERLPEYMVPSALALVEVLPLNPAGKIDRAALSRQALPAPGAAGPALAPRDTLELRLTRILEKLLGVQPVGIRSDFFELGGHSLLAVRLIARIRHELGLDLPLAALFQGATVEQLAALLRRQPGTIRSEALVAIQPQGTRPPFFCVHPVGGHVLCYAALARHLGSDQPFYGLQEHYVEAVRAVQPEGPYRLGGWSMGGVVAYEMARRLVEEDRRVDRLVLIDSRAPVSEEQGTASEIDDATLAVLFARDMAGVMGAGLPVSAVDLRRFNSGEEVLRFLYEKMQGADLVPPGLEFSQIGRLFEIFRLNLRATERFAARAYPGRLVLFKAGERGTQEPPTSDLGWGELAQGGVEAYEIPGDHYSMLREPDVEALAERLREVLAYSFQEEEFP